MQEQIDSLETVEGAALARRARRGTGLSQRAFARLIGVHHVTVATWETCRRHPSDLALSLLKIIEASPVLALRALSPSPGDGVTETAA
jgi:DNA-binding transcriptional regulator YiaG